MLETLAALLKQDGDNAGNNMMQNNYRTCVVTSPACAPGEPANEKVLGKGEMRCQIIFHF